MCVALQQRDGWPHLPILYRGYVSLLQKALKLHDTEVAEKDLQPNFTSPECIREKPHQQ